MYTDWTLDRRVTRRLVSTNVYIQKNLRQFSCGKYGSSNEHQNVYELKVDFGEMFDNEKSFEE